MFYLKSDNNFLINKIINVLNQKTSLFSDNKEINSFATISIFANENTFFFETANDKKSIPKPFTFIKLFEEIDSILAKINIYFNELTYIPVKQNISYEKKSLILGNIHNLIFSALLLNLTSGVNKSQLYEIIWPNDKNFQINKLDTHLTNLKNLIKEKLGYQINFKTIGGKIYLISN